VAALFFSLTPALSKREGGRNEKITIKNKTPMKITLVGKLSRELENLGLAAGRQVDAHPVEGAPFDLMRFKVWVDGQEQFVTVDRFNYKKA
jgi:hypothetical protein